MVGLRDRWRGRETVSRRMGWVWHHFGSLELLCRRPVTARRQVVLPGAFNGCLSALAVGGLLTPRRVQTPDRPPPVRGGTPAGGWLMGIAL